MQIRQLLLFVTSVILSMTALAQGQTIKCWMNDDGVRECGNAVPPRYAPRGYDILSLDGVLLEKVPPQKTKEEIAELKRQAEAERAKKEAEEKKRKEDEALLKRFPTENDMRLALEQQLESLDAATQMNVDQIDYFKQDLEQTETALKNNLEEQKSTSKAVQKQLETQNEALRRRIDDIKKQIARFENEIKKKEQDKNKAKADFEADLKRYNEIKYGSIEQSSK